MDWNIFLSWDEPRKNKIQVFDLPFAVGRAGYCDLRLTGKEIAQLHCQIARDPSIGTDDDKYSGICIMHIGKQGATTVDGTELREMEYVSLVWKRKHLVSLGEHSFYVSAALKQRRERVSHGHTLPGGKSKGRRGRDRRESENAEVVLRKGGRGRVHRS